MAATRSRAPRLIFLAVVAVLALSLTALPLAGASAAKHRQTASQLKKKRKKAARNRHAGNHGHGKGGTQIPIAAEPPASTDPPAIASNVAVESPRVPSPDPAAATITTKHPTPAPAPAPTPAPAPAPGPAPAPTPTPTPTPAAAIAESGFEEGLRGWNTAGVGEVEPTTESWNALEGNSACLVALTGSENRSELIFGGDGGGSLAGMYRFEEGNEYWYGISIDVLRMTYGHPGAHNLFMQFKSEGEGSPNFGLQLWDWEGKKGLWSHSEAMGGDRYLAPLSENAWHEILIHFRASSNNTGFYELFLDGRLIDSRANVSMIVPGARSAYIKDGLYRNGGTNPGTSEILLDAARLGTSREAVLAR